MPEEFSTRGVATVAVELDESTVRAAEDELSDRLGSVSLDGVSTPAVTDGGGSSSSGVSQQLTNQLSLDRERNSLLSEMGDSLAAIQAVFNDEDFGGGGGDGIISRVTGAVREIAPSIVGSGIGAAIASRLPSAGGAARAGGSAARAAATSTGGAALAGLTAGAGGIELLERTGVLGAIESFGESLQDTLAGDLLGTLLGPAGVVGGLTLGLPDIIGGALTLDPDQITDGLQTSVSSSIAAFQSFIDSANGLSERISGAGGDLVSGLDTLASDIGSKGDTFVSEVDGLASDLRNINLPDLGDLPGIDSRSDGTGGGGGGGGLRDFITGKLGGAAASIREGSDRQPLANQPTSGPRAGGRGGGESNVTVNAPVQVDGAGDVNERSIQQRIERAVRDELGGSAGGSDVVTRPERADAFRRSNF